MESSEQRELRSLVTRIREGHCVLVLGPRVAVGTDEDKRPLDEILADELWKDIGNPSEAGGGLRRAADAYIRARGDRYLLTDFAHEFYVGASGTTEFHRDLAHLPFSLCLTATPDDLMTTAFQEAEKQPQRGHYNFTAGPTPALSDATEDRPIVYHLFGHHEDASSLVLTEVDLIRFLVAIVKERPAVPDQVRSLLNDPAMSCLFVGFGLHQWYLRVLLEVMNLYKSNRGIALEDSKFFERADRAEVAGFFSDTRRIDFRPLRWEAFAKELRAVYEAQTQKSGPAAAAARHRDLPQNAPKAFVSYASEDRAKVEELAEALEERGVDVWQDKQDLRVGQKWDKALKKVIEQDVHYVIVVQTETMVRRAEGVFHKEISLAAERQSNMAETLRFLLPVTLGPCAIMPSLTDYHVIDVATPAGIDALAKSIHEDWERRNAMTMRAQAAV